jgi:hypothetical protein
MSSADDRPLERLGFEWGLRTEHGPAADLSFQWYERPPTVQEDHA